MTDFKNISPDELKQLLENKDAEKFILVDARDEEEFEKEHLPNAINIDKYNFLDFAETTPKEKTLIIYCRSGRRSQRMAQKLIRKGFMSVYNLLGGFNAWIESGYSCIFPQS
jgi:rhodanese-related sulfurtransferase